MQWGICFKIDAVFESDLRALPPPTSERMLTNINGESVISVSYHFEYMPQSWREWQRVASMKVQIRDKLQHIIFEEYEPREVTGDIYTIAKLGKYFTEFVKYQKPFYPSGKDEFMRSLTIYAMRLHYEEMLHFEAVLAMALHFNSKCSFGFNRKKIFGKSKAILKLDRDDWKVKLTDVELKEAHKRGNQISSQKMRDKSKSKRELALSLRADGKTLNAISEIVNVSLSTVRRYVS